MSPQLFNVYIAELEKVLRSKKIDGVKLSTDRVWMFSYADDMVLLAKNKEALKDIMGSL